MAEAGVPDTAEAQLGRILYILAAARGERGVRVSELAARLGVSAKTVRDDVAQVTAREFYHAGGWVSEIVILLERDRISVPIAGDFRRPMRLTPREAGALGLALRARAAEAEVAYREELLGLAQALEKALTAEAPRTHAGTADSAGVRAIPGEGPAPKKGKGGSVGASGSKRPAGWPGRASLATAIAVDPGAGAQAGVRLLLERALAARRPVRVRYLKAGSPEPEERVVHPYALLAGEGGWYVIGYSPERTGIREFRLDRVLGAEELAGQFQLPADFDVARYTQGGRAFHAEGGVEAVVRYSARVAPWVLEHGQAERCADGSVLVRYRVADARWLVREVLRFAGEAVVEEPDEMRARVKRAAQEVVKGCG